MRNKIIITSIFVVLMLLSVPVLSVAREETVMNRISEEPAGTGFPCLDALLGFIAEFMVFITLLRQKNFVGIVGIVIAFALTFMSIINTCGEAFAKIVNGGESFESLANSDLSGYCELCSK